MPVFFREFKVTDGAGNEHIFKHYPNQDGKVIVEKDEIDSTLHARVHLLKLIETAHEYMSDNTIVKIEIQEDEE